MYQAESRARSTNSQNTPGTEPANSAPIAPDRRRHPRSTVHVPIEILQDGTNVPLRMETTDLSRGGCYVQRLTPFPVGIRLHATLWLDDDDCPILARGLVITRHPQFGNGIMFTDLEDKGDAILKRYLEGISE